MVLFESSDRQIVVSKVFLLIILAVVITVSDALVCGRRLSRS